MDRGSSIEKAFARPIACWQSDSVLVNDFEPSVFALRPQIAAALAGLRDRGAIYSSMSGSGAAVYGIFPTVRMAEEAVVGTDDSNSCFTCKL